MAAVYFQCLECGATSKINTTSGDRPASYCSGPCKHRPHKEIPMAYRGRGYEGRENFLRERPEPCNECEVLRHG